MTITATLSPYAKHQQLTSVKAMSSSNISGTYQNGEQGVGATITTASGSLTIDGQTMANGYRVALNGQTNTYENGLYNVSGVGSTVVLTRTDDFQTALQMSRGYYFPVETGTEYAGAIFTVTSQTGAVGTDAITFSNSATSPDQVTLSNTGLKIYDTNASHLLTIAPGSDLTANRTLTVTTGDAARTLDISAASVTVSAYGATLVDDAAASNARTTLGFIANTTAAYGGGGTSNAFAATGLTVNSKVSAVIRASTNSVSITKALPGTDTLTITFSADPGAATTVDYIAVG